LWLALFNLRVSQGEFASLDKALQHARQAGMPENQLSRFDAIGAAEQGQEERADSLFGQLPFSDRQEIAVWHVRHLLRTGRLAQALGVIDHGIEGERASQFWPYASIAWRLANDPRRSWLEADERLVSTLDLTNHLPPLEKLTDVLRSLHAASGEYLDQSVRGGTQTDGPLLSRIEPEIRQLRAAIVTAVRRYLAQLPPPDPLHPLLKERRDGRIRFSGSWSVRLRGAGYHANHVHPEGWISSALYIALPDRVETDAAKAGWLKIGEAPRELGIDMSSQLIEPTTGHLVLFPSWMWHGTEPFLQGERLTVAFDVRHPF
jgi:hypothetical protein